MIKIIDNKENKPIYLTKYIIFHDGHQEFKRSRDLAAVDAGIKPPMVITTTDGRSFTIGKGIPDQQEKAAEKSSELQSKFDRLIDDQIPSRLTQKVEVSKLDYAAGMVAWRVSCSTALCSIFIF